MQFFHPIGTPGSIVPASLQTYHPHRLSVCVCGAQKIALASDPMRLQAATDAEYKTEALLVRVREQVELLSNAMAPMQQYVSPTTDAATSFVLQRQEAAAAGGSAARQGQGV